MEYLGKLNGLNVFKADDGRCFIDSNGSFTLMTTCPDLTTLTDRPDVSATVTVTDEPDYSSYILLGVAVLGVILIARR